MRSNKIAVIGDKDIVLAFKAVGMDVYPSSSAAQSADTLKSIANKYSIVFITEDLARDNNQLIERYKSRTYPAVIPIPPPSGSTGYGMEGIRADVERAVGTDILFNKED
ncbi:MAG: V-type ATP synthase subunit F [Clostridia bacterium]|nr:V-type ATP synthase subunit F [Clostridia bacterium]